MPPWTQRGALAGMPVLTREGPHVTPHQQLSYDAFVALATADPAVVWLVLKGSGPMTA